ncbi:hypothetical protein JK361_39050 [Streptomyces sp. 5-8]|uniref:Uncharacterized protein n=1 Tax=Streptomyces musisoli TaxID=2802280 RepID=A0ABS1PDL7_9ACTN|nr:hypothetical protein [Streptomyces musisoli]MBL1110477.1 hypothetical protein [Streptomyces musisoli]
MPDNVARIIAGASAAFTASNMAISYAAYRRVGPRLQVEAGFVGVEMRWPGGEKTGFLLAITVRNSGQTAVKLTHVTMEVRDRYCLRLLKRLAHDPQADVTSCFFPQLPADAAMKVGSLARVRWEPVHLSSTTLEAFERPGTLHRFGVGVASGPMVYSRWSRRPKYIPTSQSMGEDNRQLTFDDLDSGTAP